MIPFAMIIHEADAKRVIDFVLKQDSEELPKERLIAFEK